MYYWSCDNSEQKFLDFCEHLTCLPVLFEALKFKAIDSAQEVLKLDKDIIPTIRLYSFYPTKPVGGIDGGMIVSNIVDFVDWCRVAVMNGTSSSKESWARVLMFPGWKMYMSTVQAVTLYDSLDEFPQRVERLSEIVRKYDNAFGYYSHGEQHLYRIKPKKTHMTKHELGKAGISTGTHYDMVNPSKYGKDIPDFYRTRGASDTISIPFHSALTNKNVEKIIQEAERWI